MEYRSKNRGSDGQSLEAPNKRFKTENNQENSPPRTPSPLSQSESNLSFLKGKSKLQTEAESCVCGICLKQAVNDGNNVYRGYIDSCDHYFCFVCIMEWAKIESKCPLCRSRFSTIRRPPKPPLFPSERLVRVPVRDQANYNSGNVSARPFDLYLDVECTVCHSSADEHVLLLCDLCDSASHTYCVGLSHVVPEGDWFCQDCSLLRDEQRQSKSDSESEELRNSDNAHSSAEDITVSDIIRPPESPVRRLERSSEHAQSELPIEPSEVSDSGKLNSSPKDITVFDIVRGPESPIRRIERTSVCSQGELDISSNDLNNSGNSNSSTRNITALDIVRDPESPIRRTVCSLTSNFSGGRLGIDKRGEAINVQDSSRLSARTMQQKRNVLDRIQALRDNWNCLRRGSLNFLSSSSSCANRIHKVTSNSAQPHSTSERWSCENGPPFATEIRSVHEIDKAWKMMNMAKSLEQKRGRKGILNQASKSPLNSKHPSTKNQLLPSLNPASIRQESLSPLHTIVNKINNHKTRTFEKQSLSLQRSQNCRTGFLDSSSPPLRLALPQNTSSPRQNDLFGRKARNLPKKTEEARVLSASSDHCSKSFSLSSSAGSGPLASNLSHAKLELPASSSRKKEVPNFKDKSAKEKDPADLKKPETNDPKSEIQSLVKLNLKLLTKEKQLEVNAFKEVAWKSTHSILAACCLEQPKPGIRIFPSSACRHTSSGLDIRRSTLMPNSCRECFYAFVKDVVNTITLEKIEGTDVK